MFRLVKNIDNSTTFPEVIRMEASRLAYSYTLGGTAILKNGNLETPAPSDFPDLVFAASSDRFHRSNIADAFYVTEGMVFKVEYIGTSSPRVGLTVGLAKFLNGMDAVSYNSSGKGLIIAIDENPQYVYVKFHR